MDRDWIPSLLWPDDEQDVPAASHRVSKAVKAKMEEAMAAGEDKVENAIDVGVSGLDDPDYRVRKFSAMMLGQLGERGRRAIPALLHHLAEQNGYVSSSIKKALVSIGPIGIPQIVAVMKGHSDSQVRARCASILSGEKAMAAFDDLRIASVEDPDPNVRYRATRALKAIKRHENPAALESLLVNANYNERGSYTWRAGPLGSRGTYLYDLWKCLMSENEAIRAETFALVKRFKLHRSEPMGKAWVRGGVDFDWADEDLVRRRLEALTLLDEHLHFHKEFLDQCAELKYSEAVKLANDLLLRLD